MPEEGSAIDSVELTGPEELLIRMDERLRHLEESVESMAVIQDQIVKSLERLTPGTGEVSLARPLGKVAIGAISLLILIVSGLAVETWVAVDRLKGFAAQGGRATATDLARVASCVRLRFEDRQRGLPTDELLAQQTAKCLDDMTELIERLIDR